MDDGTRWDLPVLQQHPIPSHPIPCPPSHTQRQRPPPRGSMFPHVPIPIPCPGSNVPCPNGFAGRTGSRASRSGGGPSISILKNAHPPQRSRASLTRDERRKLRKLLAREQTLLPKKQKGKKRNRRRDGLTKGEINSNVTLTPLSPHHLPSHLPSSSSHPFFVCISKGLDPNLDPSVVSVESSVSFSWSQHPKKSYSRSLNSPKLLFYPLAPPNSRPVTRDFPPPTTSSPLERILFHHPSSSPSWVSPLSLIS